MSTLSRDVVIQRLKDLRDAKVDDPFPTWLPEHNLGLTLSELFKAAVEYLEDEYDYHAKAYMQE